MEIVESARAGLSRWRESRAASFYRVNENLGHVLRVYLSRESFALVEPRLEFFGRVVAGVVEPAVAQLERSGNLPTLAPCDAIGRRLERVDFHPAYHDVGRAVWRSGILSAQREPRGVFEQAALFYLLSHAGEGGHGCPVVCTAGLIRALLRHGSPDLVERFLPPLVERDYDRCQRGAQFLTEVQGGSDVGANRVRAVPERGSPGAWRIHGEKWFCSVADADQFLVTARPEGAREGTAGLGCFLVPRLHEGAPNGFRLRRLKQKLGTRAMATGEIEFEGALAHPLGNLDEGFHIAAGLVLNTSRWFNALGTTGLMRRALLEASSYALERRAFGRPIAAFPAVREKLACMLAEEQASLASTFALTALVEALDRDAASNAERALFRVLVNANKLVSSIGATAVIHDAIEVLGGNGTIEDFSALPRLYRDAIVFESWEGTHDVLCGQVLRDLGRDGWLALVLAEVRARLAAASGADARALAEDVEAALARLEPLLRRSIGEPDFGAVFFRRQLVRLVRAFQAAQLLVEAAHTSGCAAAAAERKLALTRLLVRRDLARRDADDDPQWPALVEACLAPLPDDPSGEAP